MNQRPWKIITCLLLIWMVLLFLQCRKKNSNHQQNQQHPVPSVPVNVTIYPNDPQYFQLQNPGGWVYINGAGLQGLIVYKKSQQDFVALERASPANPNSSASRVVVLNDNYTLKDTISGATWQIVDGAPIQGNPWHLRLYATSYDGNKLIIYN